MSLKDTLIALFAVFLIGSTIIVLKTVSNFCSVDIFNIYRFSIFLCIIPFLKFPKEKFFPLLIHSFFNCFLNFLFLALALSTDIQASLLGIASIPRVMFITILVFLFVKEKITRYQLAGLFLSAFCLYVFKVGFVEPQYSQGIIYLLLSCLSWGIAYTILKKFKYQYSLSEICYANAFAAPMTLIYYMLKTGDVSFPALPINLQFIAMLLYAALVPILFATYIWQKLNLKYPSILLNPILNLMPFIVYLEAVILLGEPFDISFVILVGLMFASLLMCQNITPAAIKKRLAQRYKNKSTQQKNNGSKR